MPDFTLTHLLMIGLVLAVALACFRFRRPRRQGKLEGGRRATALLGDAAERRVEPTL